MQLHQVNGHGKLVLSFAGKLARIFIHPQVIENQAGFQHELAHFLGDVYSSLGLKEPDGKPSEPSHVFWPTPFADSASVFVIVPVSDVVTTFLDATMLAVGPQDLFGLGFFCSVVGNAMCQFMGSAAVFFIHDFPFDDKSLADVGKVKVLVEFVGSPYLADVDPSMV